MVRRGVEGLLVVLLAAQAARLIWLLVTPLEPLGEPVGAPAPRSFTPPADLSALDRFAAIAAPPVGAVPPPELSLAAAQPPSPVAGFRLFGVRTSIAGDGGSAILAGPDGVQASFRPGDTVSPGVTLTAVHRGSVTLSGAGGATRVKLGEESSAPPPPSAPLQPSPAPSQAVPPGAGAAPPSAASLGFNVGATPAAAPPAPVAPQ